MTHESQRGHAFVALSAAPGRGSRCATCKEASQRAYRERKDIKLKISIDGKNRKAARTPEKIEADRARDRHRRALRYATMSVEERQALNAAKSELRRRRKAGLIIGKPVEEYDQNGEPILKKNPLDYLKLTPEQAHASDDLNMVMDNGPRPMCELSPDLWAFDPDVPELIPSNKLAQEMCAGCPFIIECGKYAESLESTGVSGVWGGRVWINGVERMA